MRQFLTRKLVSPLRCAKHFAFAQAWNEIAKELIAAKKVQLPREEWPDLEFSLSVHHLPSQPAERGGLPTTRKADRQSDPRM
jgi:hypothetical protein